MERFSFEKSFFPDYFERIKQHYEEYYSDFSTNQQQTLPECFMDSKLESKITEANKKLLVKHLGMF